MNSSFKIRQLESRLFGASEALFYLLLLFTPFAYGTVENWSLSVSHLFVYSVILLYLAGTILSGKTRFELPGIMALLIILFLWGLISTAWISVYRYPSLSFLLRIVDYTLIVFYVYNRFNSAERSKRLMIAIISIGTLVAGYGLIQYYLEPSSWIRPRSLGASAPYINHNHYAGYLEMVLACGVGLFFYIYQKKRLETSILLGMVILLIFIGLLFSLSRGGILSTLAVCGFFLLVMLVRRRAGTVMMPAVLLLLISLGYLWILETEKVEERLKTLGDSQTVLTVNGRATAWESAIKAISDNPLKGYGPGTFSVIFPRYREPGIQMFFDYAHSDYLQTWVEFGIIGLLLIIAGIGMYFRRLWIFLWKERKKEDYLVLGCAGGIMALIFHSAIDFNLNLHANAILFVVLAGVFSIKKTKMEKGVSWQVPVWLAGSCCAGCILFGAWISVPVLKADLLDREVRANAEYSPLEAVELYRSAYELVPGDASYPFKIGHAYVMASRSIEAPFYLSRAREFFNESLNLNPLNSEVWLAKAFLEVETGNAQEAEKCFKGALDNDPNNPACYFYLSDYYLSRGDFPQAIQASRDGISLAHDFFNDRLQRIWANTQDINLLQGLIPPGFNQGCFLLAQHLYNCKQYQQSINQLQMCDNETRWEKPFFLLAGQNYLALNKPDSAEYYFRRGVNTKPHEIRNLRMLALLLTSQGRDKEVEELFDNALKNNIDLRKAPLHYEYAVYFGKKKNFSSQRKEITMALLEEVNNITYLELLAESYLGEQRYYEALKELRRAEKLDNRRVNTLRQIAGIYEQLGQTERAKEYCRKILTISPDDVFALKMIPKLLSPENSSAGRSNGI